MLLLGSKLVAMEIKQRSIFVENQYDEELSVKIIVNPSVASDVPEFQIMPHETKSIILPLRTPERPVFRYSVNIIYKGINIYIINNEPLSSIENKTYSFPSDARQVFPFGNFVVDEDLMKGLQLVREVVDMLSNVPLVLMGEIQAMDCCISREKNAILDMEEPAKFGFSSIKINGGNFLIKSWPVGSSVDMLKEFIICKNYGEKLKCIPRATGYLLSVEDNTIKFVYEDLQPLILNNAYEILEAAVEISRNLKLLNRAEIFHSCFTIDNIYKSTGTGKIVLTGWGKYLDVKDDQKEELRTLEIKNFLVILKKLISSLGDHYKSSDFEELNYLYETDVAKLSWETVTIHLNSCLGSIKGDSVIIDI